MEIKNSKRWDPPDYKAYLVGVVGFCLAFGFRFYLHPLLGEHFPSLLFSINCIVLAYFYGFWPSFVFLLTSFCSYCVISFLFLTEKLPLI
jgi:K+-sensing histidine kinase KdpD